jgi:hypothetical protein
VPALPLKTRRANTVRGWLLPIDAAGIIGIPQLWQALT